MTESPGSTDIPVDGLTDSVPSSSEIDEASPDVAREQGFRRILVALDASRHSQAVLEAAAELAEKLHSDLMGLFIEDINLLRLEELPFVREIRFQQASPRPLEAGEMQRKLRARAANLRHELRSIAEKYHLQSSFRVVRGTVDTELITAALEADLLAIGQIGHSVARRSSRLGSTARAAISRASSAVLLVRSDSVISPSLLVVFDGSEVAYRALAVAISMVGMTRELRVLIWGTDDEAAYEDRQAASTLIEPTGIKAEYQHFHSDDPAVVLELIKKQAVGLLVIGTTDSRLSGDIIQVLLEEAPQHVLVVR